MSNKETEDLINERGLNAPRITFDFIQQLKERVFYQFDQHKGSTSTFCHAFLDGTFYLVSGHSACVSPDNFDARTGQEIAQKKAEQKVTDKLYELEGYCLYKVLQETPTP